MYVSLRKKENRPGTCVDRADSAPPQVNKKLGLSVYGPKKLEML